MKVYKTPKDIWIISYYILGILLIFVSACTTAREITVTTQTRIIQNVPFYPQEDYQCGPSALASVLNYRGIAVSPDMIAKDIFSERARGTLNIDMVFYAQRKGLNVTQYHGTIDDMQRNIESGNPIIVLVDYGFSLYQKNHFMVIVGYNEQDVIVHSGRNREKLIPIQDFLKMWEKTSYWTLLIKTVNSKQ